MSSWRKNGQDLAQTSRKWRKKISNGESDGERKIYPSANPGVCSYFLPPLFSINWVKWKINWVNGHENRLFGYLVFNYFFIIYLIKFIFKNCLHHCCIELKGQVRKGTTHCQWYLADLHVLQGTNLDHY